LAEAAELQRSPARASRNQLLPANSKTASKSRFTIEKYSIGAEGGTRTPTPLRVHGPEPCASANSATTARCHSLRLGWPEYANRELLVLQTPSLMSMRRSVAATDILNAECLREEVFVHLKFASKVLAVDRDCESSPQEARLDPKEGLTHLSWTN
jgi:hypothetical protein